MMGDFKISDRMMRYSVFIPRFYNLCKSYGFEKGRIMPSRAFCSDENQGFPIILITKHFGAFPFNHGLVGGIVATDRHGPHAHHGKDLVIIQASHVGYEPETGQFGTYRRLQVDDHRHTASCGKIFGVMDWYLKEYEFARNNITFSRIGDDVAVVIDNLLLNHEREAGIFLNIDQFVAMEAGSIPEPLNVFSTSKAFRINPDLRNRLPKAFWQEEQRTPMGDALTANLFYYKKRVSAALEGRDQLERNLSHGMARIVTSTFPALAAAQANTQIEFDRAYRTIITEDGYQGKNLAFIAGINIDISPRPGQLFPLTKFVPWAAYIQTRGGRTFLLEQEELVETLLSQSIENPDKIEMSRAIQAMEDTPEIIIALEEK
ncbi:MAG: hypothetical protein JRF32_00210 [Deltaproteobacteria bacterium]|nr:hypothetical protein [Deltaproteobacteria bacterium]MBW2175892.1 hypothetical protein [Deltaproteobacteria bacterium]MBW2296018.1 hypothetical protein [Deltaproteobacteria bacterium]